MVLTDKNAQFFRDDIWKFRSLLFRGREYWIGSYVVVTPDEENNNGDHQCMWKAKIEEFFIHEFEGMQDVFFRGAYYEQRVTNESSTIPLVHELSGMQILNSKSVETCVRPVSQLLYGFMPLPLDADNGGRRFLVAYELEDPVPRKHLINVGEPGFCPPFPVVGDVIVVRGERGNALNMVAIRKVHDKNSRHAPVEENLGRLQEEEHLVSAVDVSYLRRRGP